MLLWLLKNFIECHFDFQSMERLSVYTKLGS